MKRAEALYLRSIVEQTVISLDDKIASTVPALFRTMKYNGKAIEAGTRIQWNGKIKTAAVTLWDNEASNPDNSPTLWDDLPYRDGIRVIPPAIYVTAPFSENEEGWWGDVVYVSLVNNNVYTPEQYPGNWKLK